MAFGLQEEHETAVCFTLRSHATIWLQYLATDSNTILRFMPCLLAAYMSHKPTISLTLLEQCSSCLFAGELYSGFQGYLPRATLHRCHWEIWLISTSAGQRLEPPAKPQKTLAILLRNRWYPKPG